MPQKPQNSTQGFLEFARIRDGVIMLKNKGLRSVMMISSLNFALKSEEEQNAIIYRFQSFLNSLDFSCQILIQSRRLNIIGYLDKLKDIEKKEKNELLKAQIADYRNFIEGLIAEGTIMQKTFYVVVPFSTMEAPQPQQKITQTQLTEEEFQRAKSQLMQRAEFVALGLRECGLQSIPLNTPEIIELFWSLNHPVEAEKGYHPEIPPELLEEQ